jgi:hypothetical protein
LEKKVLNHGQPEVNVSSRLRYPELDQNGVWFPKPKLEAKLIIFKN